MKERDELDGLINEALAGYASAAPLGGLEERVLRRIELASARRRRVWWWAVPAMAALVVAGVVAPGLLQRPVEPIPIARALAPAGPAAELLERRVPRVVKTTPVRRQRALPKEELFPMPSRMTREERLLVAWAGRAPEELRQAFEDLQRRTDEPIAIPPIEITPLDNDGEK